MTISLSSYCAFPSIGKFKEAGLTPRQDDWDAFKAIQVLKDDSVNGYGHIPILSGNRVRIVTGARQLVVSVAAEFAVHRMKAVLDQGVVLVPVPSSNDIEFEAQSIPYLIACAISAKHSGVKVEHVLAFKEALGSDHERSRNGQQRLSVTDIQGNLRDNAKMSGTPVVLIDDVCTRGTHLRAAANHLRGKGCTVNHAFTVGRTKMEQVAKVFELDDEELELDLQAILGNVKFS